MVGACDFSETATEEVAQAPEPADLVLRGGIVVTVDETLGAQQAIAIRGFKIQAVGSDEDISSYIGQETEVIELNGRMAMPGFIEGHGHYMSLGRARQILDLTSVANWDEIVSMVSQAVDSAKPGEWIFGRGWHQEKWDSVPQGSVDGVPLHGSLSAISPDNPVYLGHASGHAAYANEVAMALAGVGDDSLDPAGGTIVRSADGRATGLLRENAQDLVEIAIQKHEARLSPEERDRVSRERVLLAGSEALHFGITSFHDAGASFETIDFFKMLELEGTLPIRLYVMVRSETNEVLEEKLADYLMPAEGNDYLTVRSIKRQIDGALGSHGAWLLEPYEDMKNTAGLVLEEVADIERTAELAAQFGYQVNTHAIGTRANRETLDLYERAWKTMEISGKDLRWRIEHAQHIHPEDVPRFANLGVIAAMQGVHCTSDGPWLAFPG